MSDNNHLADANHAGAESLSLSERVRSLRLPEPARGGGPAAAWLPWAACLVLTGLAAVFAFMPRNGLSAEEREILEKLRDLDPAAFAKGDVKPNADPGNAAQQLASGDIAFKSKGYIIPISTIQVSPKVGGMVMELYIEEGMKVKEGKLLAELEDVDYRADRDRAKGAADAAKSRWDELWKYRQQEVQQVKADLDDGQAQLEQLAKDYQRTSSLKLSNTAAQKEFELAESTYKSMLYRVERWKLAYELLVKGPRDEKIAAAKGDWEQALADLAKAQWKLDNTKVTAPIGGIILNKKAEKGNQVNPAAFSNGLSASLCEMADLTKLEVDLSIAERDIAKVFPGQVCDVRAEAYLDRPYKGKVSRIMPTADRSKGAVPVRVIIEIPAEEEGQYLRPEMGAIVTFYNKK